MLFRITTLTLDNSQTASGPTAQVSKETTRTSLRARALAKSQKWIFQEFNTGRRLRNNRTLNLRLHTSLALSSSPAINIVVYTVDAATGALTRINAYSLGASSSDFVPGGLVVA